MKKIVFFDYSGHPFVHDLSKKFSSDKKYQIYHLYNPNQLGPKGNFFINENEKIIEVRGRFSRNFYKKLIYEFIYGIKAIYYLNKIKPHIVITANMPIPSVFLISLSKKFINFKLIFWLQDITSIAAKNILKRKKNLLWKPISYLFKYLEFSTLKRSEKIITITEDFNKILIEQKISENKIHCVPNWAPIKDLNVFSKINNFSKMNSMTGSFNIMYSGTLGYKHNPDVLIELATFLKEKKLLNAKVVIISEGPVVDHIKQKALKNNLNNILFLPFQKFEIFPEVLASSDCNIVMLEDDSSEFCVPSKFLSILCSKRTPIVYVKDSNLIVKIINEHKCGIHVKNQTELNKAILDVYSNKIDSNLLSANARAYAEKYFDIENIYKKFTDIIFNT